MNKPETLSMPEITGHIIPLSWYQHLKINDKTDVNAIIVLAEIVGRCVKTKTAETKISYKTIEKILGLSTKQTREALKRLESHQLLQRKFETTMVEDIPLTNTMFIELNVANLNQITH